MQAMGPISIILMAGESRILYLFVVPAINAYYACIYGIVNEESHSWKGDL